MGGVGTQRRVRRHVLVAVPRAHGAAEAAARLAQLNCRRPVRTGSAPDDLAGLAALFDEAAADGADVALVSPELIAADEALLRLLDDPGQGVTVLVRSGTGRGQRLAHPLCTQGSALLAAADATHPLTDPDAEFLGALFVPARTAAPAAAALRAAADRVPVCGDLVDTVLLVLARTPSVPAATVLRAEPFLAVRTSDPGVAAAARIELAADRDPLRAARSAARPGDGVYSTFVLRRLSRRVTPWAVAHGIPANRITGVSAGLGLAGAACFAAGSRAGLVGGAVLLQASILLDCVDGEVARSTRSRTAFGAWLDAVTDRVKEYGALAGLAAAGDGLWPLALAGMSVQTARHLQDFAFAKTVLATWRAGMRDVRPLEDTSPWQRPRGAGRGPDLLSGPPTMWLRRLFHMPIGERWLVLSLAALAGRPWLGLAGYLATGLAAEAWSLAGAVRRSRGALARYGAASRRRLAGYRDDGPLRLGAPDGVLGWALPPLTVGIEAATLLTVTLLQAPGWAGLSFAWFAVVAWHRYDLVYRRDGAEPSVPPWVLELGGGWAVRSAVLAGAAACGELVPVLVGGTVWLAAVHLPESLRAGLRTRAADRRDAAGG